MITLKKLALCFLSSLLIVGTILDFDAFAYIDPGSGSMLLQLLLGGIAGIGVLVKLYWGRAKDTWDSFRRRRTKTDQ